MLQNALKHSIAVKHNAVLVGDNFVGISAFVERLANNTFENKFTSQQPVIAQAHFDQGTSREFIINVTAFPYQFDKSILSKFEIIGKIDIVIVMFAFDSIRSLNSVLQHITDMCAVLSECRVLVIGNKADLDNKSVSDEMVATARSTWPAGTKYYTSSALTGDNVRECIYTL